MFVVEHEKKVLFDFPNLKVYVPTAGYLLAMKVSAARANTSDRDDIEFLIRELKLENAEKVFEIVREFYPKKQLKPQSRFLIEEIFEQK
jgi:hypothetical protein